MFVLRIVFLVLYFIASGEALLSVRNTFGRLVKQSPLGRKKTQIRRCIAVLARLFWEHVGDALSE
jgi:hypothetical protein